MELFFWVLGGLLALVEWLGPFAIFTFKVFVAILIIVMVLAALGARNEN